jgi:hypothetical protein
MSARHCATIWDWRYPHRIDESTLRREVEAAGFLRWRFLAPPRRRARFFHATADRSGE